MNYLLTRKSRNKKTGPLAVSTSPRSTCPDACPLKGKACYARFGPLGLLWNKLDKGEIGMSWKAFLAAVRALPDVVNKNIGFRHDQAGDLPGKGDTLDHIALAELVDAAKGKGGFTYTHKPLRSEADKAAILAANNSGFTINLSADSLSEADRLASLKIGPVVVTLPYDTVENTTTPRGRKVVLCPSGNGITCLNCKLCAWSDREAIIGFPRHGPAKKLAA
jgi:hypothetical protein